MYFEDVDAGCELSPLRKAPSNVQLFRFSAVTWNAHRIHYDRDYAAAEGYQNILVQSHLHGCFLAQAALAWTSGSGVLRRFRWENRHFAVAGDTLTCTGIVKDTYQKDGWGLVDIEMEERNQDGLLCAPGWATVALPLRATDKRERGH